MKIFSKKKKKKKKKSKKKKIFFSKKNVKKKMTDGKFGSWPVDFGSNYGSHSDIFSAHRSDHTIISSLPTDNRPDGLECIAAVVIIFSQWTSGIIAGRPMSASV